MQIESERMRRIRELNDAFSTTFQGGRVLITSGVESLGEANMARAVSSLSRILVIPRSQFGCSP